MTVLNRALELTRADLVTAQKIDLELSHVDRAQIEGICILLVDLLVNNLHAAASELDQGQQNAPDQVEGSAEESLHDHLCLYDHMNMTLTKICSKEQWAELISFCRTISRGDALEPSALVRFAKVISAIDSGEAAPTSSEGT